MYAAQLADARDATIGASFANDFKARLVIPERGLKTRGNAMPTEYWRSPETIERLKHFERPGFAVEFLRRNADYRRDYVRTQRQIARNSVDAEAARSDLARRWGLRFRPRSAEPLQP